MHQDPPSMLILQSTEACADFLDQNTACLIYFSAPDCKVCQVLKPKVIELCRNEFPRLVLAYVDCKATPELAGQNRVFTIPVVTVFFEAQETLRKSRGFGLGELRDAIQRPYQLLFQD